MKQSEKDRKHAYHLKFIVGHYVGYFERELGFGISARKQGKKHRGHHHFIPSSNVPEIIHFINLAKAHIRKKSDKPISFLDCGCGIGNIMILAKATGGLAHVDGVEYDPATWRVAKKLLKDSYIRSKVFKGDLVNFRHYANYDILYFYLPISDPGKRKDFMNRLMNRTKVGAVIISYNHSRRLLQDDRFKLIRRTDKHGRYPIWEKVRE